MPTELGPVACPDAVLFRTNTGAMAQVMAMIASGQRVALAGGGDGLRALALAARDLKEGRRTTHPELLLFPTWGELQDYAAHDPAGRDLQPWSTSLTSTAPTPSGTPWLALLPSKRRRLHPAERQWSQGRQRMRHSWADRRQRGPPRIRSRHPYRQRLDMDGLAWIDHHPDGNPVDSTGRRNT